MSSNIQVGNAKLDSTDTRGWFVGSFIEKKIGLRHTEDLELKWDVLKAGDAREEWATNEARTTIGILISGKLEMKFRQQNVLLDAPGDYVMWGKSTDHKWRMIEDGIFLTVRWPSLITDKE